MTDRVTANLPSRDFARTERFYRTLGFSTRFKDQGWMIVVRDSLEIEFFPHDVRPHESCFSACIRVNDLDSLYADFVLAGLPDDSRSIPRLIAPTTQRGLRMFALIDEDGSLLRCIQNPPAKRTDS